MAMNEVGAYSYSRREGEGTQHELVWSTTTFSDDSCQLWPKVNSHHEASRYIQSMAFYSCTSRGTDSRGSKEYTEIALLSSHAHTRTHVFLSHQPHIPLNIRDPPSAFSCVKIIMFEQSATVAD